MTIEMRPQVDSFPGSIVSCVFYGSSNRSGATARAECVRNFSVDAARVCLKALTNVDGEFGVRPIRHAIVRTLAVAAKP